MGVVVDDDEEFFDLWRAETADDLHRALVLYPPMRDAEPFELLSKHHEIDPASTAVTAMLMVTDRRWRRGAGNLIRQIEQSGMLDDDALDLLAEAFLEAGDSLYWEVPDHWFSDEGIVIWVGEPEETDEVAEEEEEEEEDEQPTVARRDVVPPLRRWAAARLVGPHPERWGDVFSRARDLHAKAAAAAVSGLLDVIDVLKGPTQAFLIEEATRWPDHGVRRQAITLVAERKGAEAAHAVAIQDSNAGIRKWAASLLNAPVEPPTLF